MSFTVSLDCLVNKTNVFLTEYSIRILPLSVTNYVPRVHTVNKCGAHTYAKYPILKQVTSMFFYEDDKPHFQTHKNKIRVQHILIIVDCEERVSKWMWTLKENSAEATSQFRAGILYLCSRVKDFDCARYPTFRTQ